MCSLQKLLLIGITLECCVDVTGLRDWLPFGANIDGEAADDESGLAVSLSSDGTSVAVGARYNDGNGASSGHVRVYWNSGTSWSQVGDDIDGSSSGDLFGRSVSLSADGNTVAIGAIENDVWANNAGQVRVFQWGSSFDGWEWGGLGSPINGEDANDLNGLSVSLSPSGTMLCVASHEHDGDNGDASGSVRVFEYATNAFSDSGTWTLVGSAIHGEAAGDWSGWSVSLSSSGSRVAIGGF